MMRFVHQRVGVQSWVCHNSVDEVVHHSSDVVNATKSVVKEDFSSDCMIKLLKDHSVPELVSKTTLSQYWPMLRMEVFCRYAPTLSSGHPATKVRGRWPDAIRTASN
jgi:hypothetical protein